MNDLARRMREYAEWGAEKHLVSQASDLIEQLQVRVVELEQERDGYKESARQYQNMAAKGIFYTYQQIAERDAEVAKSAIRTALRNLGAPNITESNIQIFANEYAERVREGKV